MRFRGLIGAALLAHAAGCGSSGGEAVGPTTVVGRSGDSDVETVDKNGAASTTWDLFDETVLKVAVVPPRSGSSTLKVTRRYDSGAHAPLKSLHYRIVTDSTPDGPWAAFPEPTKSDLSDGIVDSAFEIKVTLPKGTVGIHFKVDQGAAVPLELKDWTVEVK